MMQIENARRLAQSGQVKQALELYQAMLKNGEAKEAHLAEAHWFIASWHQAEKRFQEAITAYQNSIDLKDDNDLSFFGCGECWEQLGDFEKALENYLQALKIYDGNARYFLYTGCALKALGREAEALDVWSIGADVDPLLQHAQYHPQADAVLKEKSAVADKALRAHFTNLHADTVGESEALKRVQEALWVQTHTEKVEFKAEKQKPNFFYMPSLPADHVFEDLDWMPVIEQDWQKIRDEYLAAQESFDGEPYINATNMQGGKWEALRSREKWNSIHLFQNAVMQEGVKEAFPVTVAALEKMPVVRVDGVILEAFFSVLGPDTHIPPHYGLANSRLTVHLPLIVPENCALRVNDQTCEQREGKILAFDDSFEHEAWNKSDQTRVVLIFEAWAPDLTMEEQEAISASFTSRTKWLQDRKIPTIA